MPRDRKLVKLRKLQAAQDRLEDAMFELANVAARFGHNAMPNRDQLYLKALDRVKACASMVLFVVDEDEKEEAHA